ncbi:MAG: hypothetical protein IJ214_12345 [Clostridia bacterium]|nr:hypothetical protein [Clostridia bacterium]
MNDRHMEVAVPDSETLEPVRERMYAYCFPNVPRTLIEQDAFEGAVRLQYIHEETARLTAGELPEGVQGFRIGDFQMTFSSNDGTGRLTAKTICPAAYGLLLRHGLLYRGAEGRRADAD